MIDLTTEGLKKMIPWRAVPKNNNEDNLPLHNILDTASGRKFLYELIDVHCGAYSQSFIFDSPCNTEQLIYFREGMKAIGHYLIKSIKNISLDTYYTMCKENDKSFKE